MALVWFDHHMHHGPSCDDIAEAVGCSGAHLRRLFNDAGLAPMLDRLDERCLARHQHAD